VQVETYLHLEENVTVTKSIFTTFTFPRQRMIYNSRTEFLNGQTETFVADTM